MHIFGGGGHKLLRSLGGFEWPSMKPLTMEGTLFIIKLPYMINE